MNRRVRDFVATLFVVGGVALLLAAFFWFSGRLSSGRARRVKVRFGEVCGLRRGDPVEVLGILRGQVSRIELAGDSALVEVALRRDVALARDARFAIRSVSYLGSDRYIMVTPGAGPEVGPDFEFQGTNEALNLEGTVVRLDRLLSELDIKSMSGELRQTRDELLSAIREAIPDLSSTASSVTGEIGRIANGIDSVRAMLDNQSTARKLLTSDSLYNELRATNNQLQALLKDIQEHPEKYFKLRLK